MAKPTSPSFYFPCTPVPCTAQRLLRGNPIHQCLIQVFPSLPSTGFSLHNSNSNSFPQSPLFLYAQPFTPTVFRAEKSSPHFLASVQIHWLAKRASPSPGYLFSRKWPDDSRPSIGLQLLNSQVLAPLLDLHTSPWLTLPPPPPQEWVSPLPPTHQFSSETTNGSSSLESSLSDDSMCLG